jgi:alkylhydroperoxidase family enzyme
MSFLERAAGAETAFEGALGLRPELLAAYKAFYGQLWDAKLLPARLLELCRLRIAELHGCRAEAVVRHAEAGDSDLKPRTELERRALALAEKLALDHHAITDDETEWLRAELGEPGLVALLLAVSLFDANARLRIALEIEPEPATVAQPASAHGPLY